MLDEPISGHGRLPLSPLRSRAPSSQSQDATASRSIEVRDSQERRRKFSHTAARQAEAKIQGIMTGQRLVIEANAVTRRRTCVVGYRLW